MRLGNPTLSKNKFQEETINLHGGAAMTINGVLQKTTVMFLLLLLSASFVWDSFMKNGFTPLISGLLIGGLIAGIILALITIFSRKTAMYTAPLYAIAEGFVLGAISAFFEVMYPGIAMQAIMATLAVFVLMLILYKQRIIQATPMFTKVMLVALAAVFLTYLIGMIVSLFGVSVPLFGNGPFGILFSAIVAGVAAFSLILDFNMIEQGVKLRAPQYMEWYASFGLMVTLIWLYLEILKLFAKLQSRD